MSNIKNIIKKMIGKYNSRHLYYSKRLSLKLKNDSYSKESLISSFLKTNIIRGEKNKSKQLLELFKKINLEKLNNNKFYYSIDIYKSLYIDNPTISNMTLDYERILNYSLEDFEKRLNKSEKNNDFYYEELDTIKAIYFLIDRIIEQLDNEKVNTTIINNIKNIKNNKTEHFYEALQRILFFNQILWQTGHELNGLGRLDLLLYPYYKKDIDNNIITKDDAIELLREFLINIHKYYYFKSCVLSGDTGQIIEIGGINENSEYQCNELSYLFIDIVKELQFPDPKILLRVNKDTPKDLMKHSLESIQTGIGCPLFANDDIIIPKLIAFGYDKKDSYNYGTSACWEPYIIGKSLDQNNLKSIVFIKPFEDLLELEDLNKIDSFEELIELYKKYLEIYIHDFITQINKIKFEKDPFLSLFIDDCIDNNKDVSEGGAKYNNYGFTGVGLSNLINSLININQIVFVNKENTLNEINQKRINNFIDNNELLNKLKNNKNKYGIDNKEIIDLTNNIIEYTTKIFENYKNPLGGKYKFGLSAPSYIEESKNFPASFDGRKIGEPFGVHISSDTVNGYTELINFASKLNYNGNRFNGNVVDFFISPNFISDNFEKFLDFLMLSIKVGFFEMQMNVVSSKTLIEARNSPEKFPNLIVRVWGFSAYFKDLPDEYKDYLIERAIKSESNS